MLSWVKRRRAALILALLGLSYLALAVGSLRVKSVTVDEFGHLPAGFNLLTTGDYRYCELNPPLMTALSALPVVLFAPGPSRKSWPEPFTRGFDDEFGFWENGYAFMFDYRAHYRRFYTLARLVTVALVGGLGVLCFFWAREVTDRRSDFAGLLAAGLVWFSPNVLAHARLVTTDAGAATFIALALGATYLFLKKPGSLRAVMCGLALGVAQLVKFTSIYLLPLLLVLAVVRKLTDREISTRALAMGMTLALGVAVLTLNAGYGFHGTFTMVRSHDLESDAGLSVASFLPGNLPVPLPLEYVRAFDRQLRDVKHGDPSFLLGERYRGGRWDYFAVLMAFKTPIPTLLLGAFAVLMAVRRQGPPLFETLLLLLPAGLILAMFSFFSNKQIGYRLVLPCLPLVFVWIAATLGGAEWRRWTPWVLAFLLAWVGGEAARTHPDYLAYFNPFAGGSDGAGRIALDSNLDWGQDLPGLKRYLDEEDVDSVQLLYFGRVDPEIYGIRYEVITGDLQPGLVAISRTLYELGYLLYDHGNVFGVAPVNDPRPTLGEPVARIGHSIDVYRVREPGQVSVDSDY